MKLLIYGHNTEEVKKLAKKIGFEIVDPKPNKKFDGARKNPDIVASYGGDGTFMKSEKDYPGVLKFALKKSNVCKKCHELPNEEVLKKVFNGEYKIEEEIKIEAKYKKHKIIGLNEIIVHNHDPRRAIRYKIFVNKKQIGGEIIGDGVIISTPYGSTGYYRSITDSFFEVGIGVAFNNSTEQSDHMVLKENSEIIVKITRGKAVVYADNQDKEILLNDNDKILIKKSKETAKVVKIL